MAKGSGKYLHINIRNRTCCSSLEGLNRLRHIPGFSWASTLFHFVVKLVEQEFVVEVLRLQPSFWTEMWLVVTAIITPELATCACNVIITRYIFTVITMPYHHNDRTDHHPHHNHQHHHHHHRIIIFLSFSVSKCSGGRLVQNGVADQAKLNEDRLDGDSDDGGYDWSRLEVKRPLVLREVTFLYGKPHT
jgi:hypothetical protein